MVKRAWYEVYLIKQAFGFPAHMGMREEPEEKRKQGRRREKTEEKDHNTPAGDQQAANNDTHGQSQGGS